MNIHAARFSEPMTLPHQTSLDKTRTG